MGKFYARSEDAIEDFWAVVQWASSNNSYGLSNRDLIDRTLAFFHSLQRGADPLTYARRHKRDVEGYERRRKRLLAKGLCVVCGKRKVVPGYTRCRACREDAERRRREYDKLAGAVAYRQKKEQEVMACTL
ncbi:MAG TPA: hypothetical protein GX716_06030 [Firmicutes bacterium]|nr:hypothetical protein [Candidatus Fermentithermobacillaceae bacterium]